jgi:hypothetical protein
MAKDVYCDGNLTLELDDGDAMTLLWLGQSTARDPGVFLRPILGRALELAAKGERQIVLDFRQLGYMNSSTITPVIRTLEQAKRAGRKVRVLYNKARKWQALSFLALGVFQTPDKSIEIVGV